MGVSTFLHYPAEPTGWTGNGKITIVMPGALPLSPVSQFHGRVSLLEEVAP